MSLQDFNHDAPSTVRTGGYRNADRPAERQPAPNLCTLQQLHGGDFSDGGRRLSMPGPGHGRNDRSLSLRIADDGRLLAYSFANDPFGDVAAYLGLKTAQGRAQTPQEVKRERDARTRATALERARKAAFCRLVWADTLPAIRSPVETYLRSRAITGPIPNVLRFHPAAPLSYDGRNTAPAMVAIVTGPDGKSSGLHVTAIKPDGSDKALGDRSRRMFGDMSGAAVRLSDIPASGDLGLSEGIETGLAYRDLTGWPVWSCLSTSGLRGFNPPPGLKRLAIAADGDKSGIDAANALAERASRRCATTIAPAPDSQDWNDVLKESAA
ncbi:toprim domain-containing protein [Phenylobacterium sp.]|uniref:DUF7146 domain-containing protein n=1 Tax=Phenylobacterium sp. TaxID=1871053 RepID=UPI00374D291A